MKDRLPSSPFVKTTEIKEIIADLRKYIPNATPEELGAMAEYYYAERFLVNRKRNV